MIHRLLRSSQSRSSPRSVAAACTTAGAPPASASTCASTAPSTAPSAAATDVAQRPRAAAASAVRVGGGLDRRRLRGGVGPGSPSDRALDDTTIDWGVIWDALPAALPGRIRPQPTVTGGGPGERDPRHPRRRTDGEHLVPDGPEGGRLHDRRRQRTRARTAASTSWRRRAAPTARPRSASRRLGRRPPLRSISPRPARSPEHAGAALSRRAARGATSRRSDRGTRAPASAGRRP